MTNSEDTQTKNGILDKLRLANSLYPSIDNCALMLDDQLYPAGGYAELKDFISWIPTWMQYRNISILITPIEKKDHPVEFTCRAI